ncbi:hypothetical protein Y032_0304g1927 [Ancylostoma ceylanicum]|uniref:Uncharacterized protein n=1 Tax=Ancylostoma ceylanicum TaxID=53326 RepID=A0A016S471_9BILA|nr:hypothetical protein Y032_0304g1927 [Ancylostoma ceylanicum]
MQSVMSCFQKETTKFRNTVNEMLGRGKTAKGLQLWVCYYLSSKLLAQSDHANPRRPTPAIKTKQKL